MKQSKKSVRRERREMARKKRQQRKYITLAVIGVGVILLVAGFYLVLGGGAPPVVLDYGPEDIMYDFPLHAIHEMEPSTVSLIPFLPDGGPQPIIAIPEDFYDFGVIGATDIVQYDFVIGNTGDADLIIFRVYTTCGCTTVEVSSTVIPPGKVIIMTVIMDAGFHDLSGQTVRRGIIIESTDPDNPEVEIWVSASVP